MEIKQEVDDEVVVEDEHVNYEHLFIKVEPKEENTCYYLDAGEETLLDSKFVIPKLEQRNAEQNNYKFCCYSCSYKTNARAYFVKHVRRHMGIRPYACFVCHFRGAEASDLKRHLNVHLESSPYSCSKCDFESNRKHILSRHIAQYHGGRHYGTNKIDTTKKFKCDLCSYRTCSLKDVTSHRSRHFDDRPFHCTKCSWASKTKQDLYKHYGIHNDYKPHACKLCNYKGRRFQHLKSHMRTHLSAAEIAPSK